MKEILVVVFLRYYVSMKMAVFRSGEGEGTSLKSILKENIVGIARVLLDLRNKSLWNEETAFCYLFQWLPNTYLGGKNSSVVLNTLTEPISVSEMTTELTSIPPPSTNWRKCTWHKNIWLSLWLYGSKFGWCVVVYGHFYYMPDKLVSLSCCGYLWC